MKKKAETLYKDLNFLKGFVCPTHGGDLYTLVKRTLAITLVAAQIMWNLGPGVAMMSL